MRTFARFTILYLTAALIIALVSRDQPFGVVLNIAGDSLRGMFSFWRFALGPIAGVVLVLLAARRQISSARYARILYAIFGASVFQAGFIVFKTSLPFIRPYFADPFLAKLDNAIHGGTDPFYFTLALARNIPVDATLFLYLWVWLIPAVIFPVILAATDDDLNRVKRFIILFVIAWVGLGNFAAVLGSSVGPVYYDRLLGGTRFAELTEALAANAVGTGKIGQFQDFLWRAYSSNAQIQGTGISAFPSVHVAMATVFALYLWERSVWLAPVGVMFLALILFLSVYTGYHYAIDGYASIIVVGAGWFVTRQFVKS